MRRICFIISIVDEKIGVVCIYIYMYAYVNRVVNAITFSVQRGTMQANWMGWGYAYMKQYFLIPPVQSTARDTLITNLFFHFHQQPLCRFNSLS